MPCEADDGQQRILVSLQRRAAAGLPAPNQLGMT
jgi:hypothetical protein